LRGPETTARLLDTSGTTRPFHWTYAPRPSSPNARATCGTERRGHPAAEYATAATAGASAGQDWSAPGNWSGLTSANASGEARKLTLSVPSGGQSRPGDRMAVTG